MTRVRSGRPRERHKQLESLLQDVVAGRQDIAVLLRAEAERAALRS